VEILLNKKPKICYTGVMVPESLFVGFSAARTIVVVLAVMAVACLDLIGRTRHERTRYALAVIVGTVLAAGLIETARAIFGDVPKQGQAIALGVFLTVIAWRLLFGTWDANTKATVLGTFVFWVLFTIIGREDPQQRFAHLIAIAVAAVPAVIWCTLFFPYRKEKPGVILSMIFAGMLSTIPILFYDALVRSGADLHFFLFRIVPESFSNSARLFVAGNWPGIQPLQSSLLSMFLSFVLVGVIEEGSKFWVLRSASKGFARSIDDVMQMAILVAIGFAFAENVTNTGYFLGFVQEYLLGPNPNWMAFLGNVAGRSVLTSMVHIVSTGLMGYYFGVAIYAGSELQEKHLRGIRGWIITELHDIFGIEKRDLYRRMKILTGYALAIFLHAFSNFLVSLPDALPGNPRTMGDLLGSGPGSPLNLIALLLIPTLVYVVGGFSLLTALFRRKENMQERGHLISTEVFVSEETGL
jgi:hypothetical protein